MKLAVPLLLTSLASPVLAGDVILVRADGTGDFTDLPTAVAAAADGDILLVGEGDYDGIYLDDRALAIVAEEGAVPRLWYVWVSNQSRAKTTLLSGLELRGLITYLYPTLWVRRCRGPLRIDGCTITGGIRNGYCAGGPAITVRHARDVAITRSTATGGQAGTDPGCNNDPPRGGAGLRVDESTVAAWRSLFTGGAGENSVFVDLASAGGHGALINHGELYAFYDLFAGGKGGDDRRDGIGPRCEVGGDGLNLSSSAVYDQSSILLAGEGGFDPDTGPCADGEPLAGSGWNEVAGLPRALEGPRVVTEGASFVLDVYAAAGELASLAISRRTDFLFVPAFEGARYTGPLLSPLVPLARVDGDGHVAVTFTAPALQAGEEGEVLYLQLVVQDAPDGTLRLGSPIALVVVEAP